MARTTRRAAALAAAMLLAACGGSSSKKTPNPGGGALTVPVSGVVYSEGSRGATASPASGVTVTAKAGASTATATTGADGAFTLTVSAASGDQLLVSFEQAGSAKLARTFRVYSAAAVSVSPTMRPLTSLTCDTGGACQLDSGKLTLGNLDAGTYGKARVFNPATEIGAFPGSFSDSAGNLLVSGVFSALEMKTASGAALTQMPVRATAASGATIQAAADLKMEVPKETWPSVRDMTPSGDAVIVVPLYAFNEATGQWQYERDGALVDGTGAEIPASQLAAIRAQTFAGPIFARGQVTHFSWWNVDWPVETHGCVTGRVLDAAGHVATGAVVTVSLADAKHNGTSQPVTVGADGRFCLESLRSEGAGEDVDGDGVTGETHHVVVRVTFGGALYDLGAHAMPGGNGTCGASGACLDLGDLRLTDATRLTARTCTLRGTVRKASVPQAGVAVWGWDESLPWDLYDAACGASWSACAPMASTDPEGAYSLVVPMIGGAQITAWWVADGGLSWRWGQTSTPAPSASCPAGPFDVNLDQGLDWVTLAVSVQGVQITWSPPDLATLLSVQSLKTGTPRWMIEANTGVAGLASPVRYGSLPAGAVQLYPDPASVGSAVPALAACDDVSLLGQSYAGAVYRFATGSCVLLELSAGVLTCVPYDDPRVSPACSGAAPPVDPGGVPSVDPGSAATIVGTWLGDTNVSTWMGQGFSGIPTLVVGGDGTWSVNFDSSGAVEVSGTYTWSGGDVVMQDTAGPQACLGTGTTGRYTPELYADSGTSYLYLTQVGDDACAGRSSLLQYEYWTKQATATAAAASTSGARRIVRLPTRR